MPAGFTTDQLLVSAMVTAYLVFKAAHTAGSSVLTAAGERGEVKRVLGRQQAGGGHNLLIGNQHD